jgi:TonB family protein
MVKRRDDWVLTAGLWSLAAHLFIMALAVRASSGPRTLPTRGTIHWLQQTPAERMYVASAPAQDAQAARLPPLFPGLPPDAVPGPGDAFHPEQASPFPRADVDSPDRRAAAHGGGGPGGTPTVTGRNDRNDNLRAQPWNDPGDYRLPRTATDRHASSPEQIVRMPRPGLDTATRRPRTAARVGDTQPAPRPEPGGGGLQLADGETLPVAAPGPTEPALTPPDSLRARPGVMEARPGRAGGQAGDPATEARDKGLAADSVDASQASNERDPTPFELTRPSAGQGDTSGVASPRPGQANSARSPRTGTAEGGSPADLVQATTGQASTRARAQDAYIRRLIARVAELVVYPADLAAHLEQGLVVVVVTVRKDGSLERVEVTRSSGFASMDAAIVSAVKRAAPFGPVPAVLAQGHDRLTLPAPFTFTAPLIR